MNYVAPASIPQGPQPFLTGHVAPSGQIESGREETVTPSQEAGFPCDFSSVAVTQEPILAFVMRTKRLITPIWTSFFPFIVVEEVVEMLKYLQYTEYTQFYSSISPTYGFKLFHI